MIGAMHVIIILNLVPLHMHQLLHQYHACPTTLVRTYLSKWFVPLKVDITKLA